MRNAAIFILFCSIYFKCNGESSESTLIEIKRLIDKHLSESSGNGCHEGWMEYNNHCYYVSSVKSNWNSAEAYCKSYDSHLVTIETAKENAWIASKLPQDLYRESHVLWIGGNDIKEEGVWKWAADSTDMTYKNWDTTYMYDEPNGGTSENCVNMIRDDEHPSRNGKWNDKPCSNSVFFMCENGVHACVNGADALTSL